MKEYFFIYNIKQGQYFLESGLVPLEVGMNVGKVYLKFLRDNAAEEVFKNWCNGDTLTYK